MTCPKRLSCSQLSVTSSALWITPHGCTWAIRPPCSLYFPPSSPWRKKLFSSHHLHVMDFLLCCYGNPLIFHDHTFTHTYMELQMKTQGELQIYENIITNSYMQTKHLVPRSQWERTRLDFLCVNHCFDQKPFNTFPRHSSQFPTAGNPSTDSPHLLEQTSPTHCLLIFSDKKDTEFIFLNPLAQFPPTNSVAENKLLDSHFQWIHFLNMW